MVCLWLIIISSTSIFDGDTTCNVKLEGTVSFVGLGPSMDDKNPCRIDLPTSTRLFKSSANMCAVGYVNKKYK